MKAVDARMIIIFFIFLSRIDDDWSASFLESFACFCITLCLIYFVVWRSEPCGGIIMMMMMMIRRTRILDDLDRSEELRGDY